MGQSFAWPLLSGAEASLADIREQARSDGYATGLAEGRSVATREVDELRTTLKASLRALPAVAERLEAVQAQAVAAMILQLTEALTGVEVRTNPAVLERLVQEALSALAVSDADLTLHVSTEDAAWLEAPAGFTLSVETSRRPGTLTVTADDLELEFDPFSRLAQLREAVHESDRSAVDTQSAS